MSIDYKKYPPDWLTRIRPAVLERANNCCEECGVRNYAIIKRTGDTFEYIDTSNFTKEDLKPKALKEKGLTKVVLTISHSDHDAENHNVKLERLKALCQKCHLRLDLPRHIYKRKYGMEVFKNPSLFD